MSKISDSQRGILKAASKQPKTDVREFMTHIKSPPIRDKVVTALLNNGLIIEDPDAEGIVYVISEAGFEAIGKKPPAHDTVREQEAAVPEPEAKVSAKKREPKPKREGATKKQMMIDMLSREEGATKEQLMDATGWQKHSVQGGMSNLNDELIEKCQQTIVSTKAEGKARMYKIIPYEPAQDAPAEKPQKEKETVD